MPTLPEKLKAVLKPAETDTKAWGDVLVLLVFGGWFFTPIFVSLFSKPDPHAYACGGPGPADFGCTGGRDAIIGNTIGAIFMLFLFTVFAVAAIRLINRWKRQKSLRNQKD